MSVTIDASVFVAAARDEEVHHEDSLAFLAGVQERACPTYVPSLVLPESAAAIARPTGDLALAERLVRLIEDVPGIEFVPLTPLLARQAAHLAMQHRLRGADAVYVATAELFGATLVAWGREVVERGAGAVATRTPTQWLAEAAATDALGEQ